MHDYSTGSPGARQGTEAGRERERVGLPAPDAPEPSSKPLDLSKSKIGSPGKSLGLSTLQISPDGGDDLPLLDSGADDWRRYCHPETGQWLPTTRINPVRWREMNRRYVTREAKAVFTVGGSLIKLQREGVKFVDGQGVGGIRGEIKTFSRDSRRRLMRKVAALEATEMPVFVTLTYPAEFPDEPEIYKRHLDSFAKRFRRRFPGGAFIWRLEFQKRGAPHYHLLVYGADYLDLLRWVSDAWYEVVKSGDEKHLRAGTRVEQIRSARGTMWYASKYLAKVETLLHTYVGRWWGVIARKNLPQAEQVEVYLLPEEADTLVDKMSQYAGYEGDYTQGLTIFGDAALWLGKLCEMLKTDGLLVRMWGIVKGVDSNFFEELIPDDWQIRAGQDFVSVLAG